MNEQNKIYIIRSVQVMLYKYLAEFYDVETIKYALSL
jgi:hypothetical protein